MKDIVVLIASAICLVAVFTAICVLYTKAHFRGDGCIMAMGITSIVVLVYVISSLFARTVYSNYYPTTMQIVDLDYEADIVCMVDGNGYKWSFEGVEDWHIGDFVSLIMDSKGTRNIFDDEIADKQYSGFRGN